MLREERKTVKGVEGGRERLRWRAAGQSLQSLRRFSLSRTHLERIIHGTGERNDS